MAALDDDPPVPSPPRQSPGAGEIGRKLGRYLLLELIGQGGMGVVYSAYDPDLDRKVAIKLVRPRTGRRHSVAEAKARLSREAQALARVSHPNVVSIFDVGAFEDRVFLAMELVEGGTLRSWLDAGPREWQKVVALFRQAGAGLAAAHRAGLVHGDFKPANVLFGSDGRARVTDFGLAHRADESIAAASAEKGPADESAALGTPAYMAPEQHEGAADARSDQFSFCIALYEALFGELPPESLVATPVAKSRSSERAAVPLWLWRVLQRGLSPKPEGRFPSMEALLEALGRDPRARRLRLLAGLGLVGVMALTALGVRQLGQVQRRMCRGADRNLVEVWDGPTRRRAEQAFATVRGSYVGESWALTAKGLDRYAQDWVAMRNETCEATRVRHQQSDAVLTLRMLCLDRALRDLSLLSRQLVNADEVVVQNAAQAVLHLPGLNRCADVTALQSNQDLPSDPVLRARTEKLEAQMAAILALQHLGKYREGRELSERLIASVSSGDPPRIEAQALYEMGWSDTKLGENKRGEDDLRRSILVAVAGGDDRTLAWALVQLYFMVGYVDNDQEEAEWLRQNAQATLERLGGDPDIETWLYNAQAGVDLNRGDHLAALAHLRQAVATYDKVPEKREPQLGMLLANLSEVLLPLGRYDEAQSLLKRAIELGERSIGRQHPELAYPVTSMAQLLLDQGRFAEALPYAERSLALREHGAPLQGVADSLTALGACQSGLLRYALAAPLLSRALAIRAQAQGEAHPDFAATLGLLADLHRATGKYSLALSEGRRVISILERAQQRAGRGLIDAWTGLARTYLARGHASSALPLLLRATALVDKEQVAPTSGAESYFALAEALWGRGERRRALAAAERARQYAARGQNRRRLDEIGRWLTGHDRRGDALPAARGAAKSDMIR